MQAKVSLLGKYTWTTKYLSPSQKTLESEPVENY